jgi:hypothetical protein
MFFETGIVVLAVIVESVFVLPFPRGGAAAPIKKMER